MDVLIIAMNRNALPMPVMPIGACMVAEAAERAGHDVRVLDLMFKKDPLAAVREEILRRPPEVIGISLRNIDNNDMRRTAFYIEDLPPLMAEIRRRTSAPVVLGGAALTVMPREIMEAAGVDIAVLGDGEVVFPGLLARISSGQRADDLPGVAVRINGSITRTDCVRAGFSNDFLAPDYRRWVHAASYLSQMATVPVQTKLGCAFQCVYCTYRKIEGGSYRFSDPEQVSEAVASLVRSGFRDIEFVDSVFNAPYDHAMKVCGALARRPHGARLQSLELNPAHFDDELLRAMKSAGFVAMGLTAESASDRVLTALRKGFTSDQVHRAAEMVRRHSIPCLWIFMLGGPGETQQTVQETIRFAKTAVRPSDAVFFNIGVRIYPGTELEVIARREGVLPAATDKMLAPVFYVAPGLDAEWIGQQVKAAMARNLHFINGDSIGFSHLPMIHRIAYGLGARPPLWRHTRLIRRGLRMMGMDV